jgi:hypothetical protein
MVKAFHAISQKVFRKINMIFGNLKELLAFENKPKEINNRILLNYLLSLIIKFFLCF